MELQTTNIQTSSVTTISFLPKHIAELNGIMLDYGLVPQTDKYGNVIAATDPEDIFFRGSKKTKRIIRALNKMNPARAALFIFFVIGKYSGRQFVKDLREAGCPTPSWNYLSQLIHNAKNEFYALL